MGEDTIARNIAETLCGNEKPALREKYCGGRLVEEQTKACGIWDKISITVKL